MIRCAFNAYADNHNNVDVSSYMCQICICISRKQLRRVKFLMGNTLHKNIPCSTTYIPANRSPRKVTLGMLLVQMKIPKAFKAFLEKP